MKRAIIILISILAIIVIVLIIFSLRSQLATVSPKLFTIPTPIVISPNPTSGFETQSSSAFQQKQNEKLLNLVTTRAPLATTESQIKQRLITSVPKGTETIYKTDAFHVDYIPTPDIFQVEIDSIDYAKAKADAVSWFILQGFTMDNVCKMPVMFYLNFDIKQELPDRGVNFNPLAEGC